MGVETNCCNFICVRFAFMLVIFHNDVNPFYVDIRTSRLQIGATLMKPNRTKYRTALEEIFNKIDHIDTVETPVTDLKIKLVESEMTHHLVEAVADLKIKLKVTV